MKERCRRDTCALIQNAFTSHLRTGARGASGRVPAWFTENTPQPPDSRLKASGGSSKGFCRAMALRTSKPF